MLDNEPFNQTRSYLTWREDNILPYDGVYFFANYNLAICTLPFAGICGIMFCEMCKISG